MKYKFDIIDIPLILMLPITFNDFKDGYLFAGIIDVIMVYSATSIRYKEIKAVRK